MNNYIVPKVAYPPQQRIGVSAEIIQNADAIKAGRCRESLSLPGGIVEIGCLYLHVLDKLP